MKVQAEFVKYGEAISVAKKRAEGTVKAIESLDQRQRVMGRTLKGISLDRNAVEIPSINGSIDLVAHSGEDEIEAVRPVVKELDDMTGASADPDPEDVA